MASVDHRRTRLAWLMFCVIGGSGLIGCRYKQPPVNSNIAPVRGRITVNGKPDAGLQVYFHSASSRPSMAMTDENGNYELQYDPQQMGAAIGSHTVRITRNLRPVLDPKPELPAKYNVDSDLKVRVVPGENDFSFDLIE